MMGRINYLTFLLFLGWGGLHAQPGYPLKLKNALLSAAEVARTAAAQDAAFWEAQTVEGRTYGIVQFLASSAEMDTEVLEGLGIQLEDYLPERAYLASWPEHLPVAQLPGARAIALAPEYKILPGLQPLIRSGEGRIAAVAYPYKAYGAVKLAEYCTAAGLGGRMADGGVYLSLTPQQLLSLSEHPGLAYLEAPPVSPTPEGMLANAVMGVPVMLGAGGLQLTGSGTTIAVGEDGDVAHPDLKGRIIRDLSDDFNTDHGEMVVGIAAGAGSIDPKGKGVASGAQVHLSFILDYKHHNLALQLYQQYGATITSTSYGDGCGGFYSSRAKILDDQVFAFPYLIHVFSAGNQGASTCSQVYGQVDLGAGRAAANLTGGRKSSKNGIVVANANTGRMLVPSSSQGPTEDGRVKPDITCIGQGNISLDRYYGYREGSGTSAAAPGIAGVLALMTEAFHLQNNGADPHTALLKAALLNTAQDLGRPGPDYEYGWGLVHAGKAVRTLEEGRYWSGETAQGGAVSFDLEIPEGVSKAKVMLAWHDIGGSPLALKALVNDLDLKLAGPDGEQFLPLVLKTAPHPDSLLAPAAAGVDRLNNVEQVVLESPVPGTYTVTVRGSWVLDGAQPFFVAYQLEKEELRIAYPVAGTAISEGGEMLITWDCPDWEAPVALSYQLEEGGPWHSITDTAAARARQLLWALPAPLRGGIRFRASMGNLSDTTGWCTIAPEPAFFIRRGENGQAVLQWLPIEGVHHYEIFKLGEMEMEPLGTSADSVFQLPNTLGSEAWYSVRAHIDSHGGAGPRAVAQLYRPGWCQNEIELRIKLDDNPEETAWAIKDETGAVLLTGGPYASYTAGRTLDIPICLPNGCFTFNIFDKGENGICCGAGNGGFEIYNGQGFLLAEGSSFGAQAAAFWCMESNQPPLQAFAHVLMPPSCHEAADGAVQVQVSGGTGEYTFHWEDGWQEPNRDSLSAGLYRLTVSDGMADIAVSAELVAPAPLAAAISAAHNNCGQEGQGALSAMASGGTSPYAYNWGGYGSGPELTGLGAGSYTLTVTDALGCSIQQTAQILTSSPAEITLLADPTSCAGGGDGSIFAEVEGGALPYAFNWSNGSTAASLHGLEAGWYSVTVTDSLGCSAVSSAQVVSPPLLQGTLNLSEEQVLTPVVGGGNPPYQFLWSDQSVAPTLHVEEEGEYSLTVTDEAGCTLVLAQQVNLDPEGPCTPQVNNNAYNWIQLVRIDTLTWSSGPDEPGYSPDNSPSVEVWPGQVVNVSVESGRLSDALPVHWRVWVDFNGNGSFEEDGELVFEEVGSVAPGHSFQLEWPQGISSGPRRMRIAQAFSYLPEACGTILYGEVEDYIFSVGDPAVYCEAGGVSTLQEWVESVRVGPYEEVSGNNGGYADFTSREMLAIAGDSVSFLFKPGFSLSPIPETWSVWVDFNRDGIFNYLNELVFFSSPTPFPVQGLIPIPANLQPGPLRVRVQMRWNTILNPCGSYSWGETEDYELSILPPEAGLLQPMNGSAPPLAAASPLRCWPVPAVDVLHLEGGMLGAAEEKLQWIVRNALGQAVGQGEAAPGQGGVDLSVGGFPAGAYQVQLKDTKGQTEVVPFIRKPFAEY